MEDQIEAEGRVESRKRCRADDKSYSVMEKLAEISDEEAERKNELTEEEIQELQDIIENASLATTS